MKSILKILSAAIMLALVAKNTNAQECVTCGNNNDVAIGQSASTSAYNAVAIGQNTVSNAPNSITIGSIAQSTSTRSITIGSGRFNSSGGNPLVNNRTSIALGIGSNLPTLRVEAAAGYNRTGNVTIGNVADVNDIKAKLHIISDSQEPSGIFLQTSDAFGQATFVKFNDDEHCISVKDGQMNINSGKNEFSIISGNANLAGNLFTLGDVKSKKLNLDANDFPTILSNATRVGSTFYRNFQGSSYAIEFKDEVLRIRTADNQDPEGSEITNWKDAAKIKTNGHIVLSEKLSINTEDVVDNYALAVNGGIITTEVYIAEADNWPDHVFAEDYKLMGLHELENYIRANRHLPEVPSEEEVHENGYDMGEMQQVLLKKVEELTLYTIQLQQQIECQQKEIEELKAK